MARRFQINELRTLVARALESGDYAPAVSARVRAVPDVRTIRYYTTLGLINPPAEMRGRVAFYDETHVMQIVAIKRLQARNVSLSDIQKQLVGLTPKKLSQIARLVADFWDAADKYLATSAKTVEGADADDRGPFWLEPAARSGATADQPQPSSPVGSTARTMTVIRVELQNGVAVNIELPADSVTTTPPDFHALQTAAQALVTELKRQQLLKD